MQAITISIGKAGIQFFAQHFLVDQLLTLVNKLAPPDKTFSVADFSDDSTTTQDDFSNIQISLTGGSLSNFSPQFDSVSQSAGGMFPLVFEADRFQVNYQWQETYHLYHCDGIGSRWICKNSDHNNQWPCYPTVGKLTITVNIAFKFDAQNKQWDMMVGSVTAVAPAVQPNIPSKSILLFKSNLCSSDHVTEAVSDAIDAIDFQTPVNGLIKNAINKIPASGDLGNNIVYDFSEGDSGIVFPNDKGIQIGVQGGASYNGSPYSGANPPSLPLPLPPADSDTHHLNMYVSNYEIDALNWAFFEAGKLNAVVNADELPDPGVLKVKTYVSSIPALKQYQSSAMQAQIVLNAAPATSFQTVYELTAAVMALLKTQLTQQTYNLLSGLQGNNYVALTDLETDLNDAGIDPSNYTTIATAAKSMGMVVTHDINFTLVIQNFKPTQPDIVFNVRRTDILGGLALGVGPNKTQTMQFSFANATWTASFVSSNIPKFDGSQLSTIWATAGEPRYDALLVKLGQNGVPVPIMQGFQFDFNNALISLQEGYVSILANVQYHS